MQTLELSNAGPVSHLTLPCPPGRIVVLQSTNDLGKSVTLANIDKAIRGEGKIDDRRGVFILDQEYWEGLAPARKQELVDLVAGTDLTVYTARATDDTEIVPVVLGEIEAQTVGA